MILDKEYFRGPSYILENGLFLNLLHNNFTTHCHYEISLLKTNNGKRHFNGKRQLTCVEKYIRINDRVPLEVLAELPLEEISTEQYVSLEMFFNDLIDKGIYFVEIGIEPKGSVVGKWTKDVIFYHRYDLLEIKPERIIQEIKNFYIKEKIK